MISFVLFSQASQPCMNFNISELVYWRLHGTVGNWVKVRPLKQIQTVTGLPLKHEISSVTLE